MKQKENLSPREESQFHRFQTKLNILFKELKELMYRILKIDKNIHNVELLVISDTKHKAQLDNLMQHNQKYKDQK